MHLQDIEIKNFKSIRHQKIEGCKRINLFIGPPNVGKSNILEALSFLCYLKDDAIVDLKSICRVEDYSELFFDGNTQDSIEISYSKTRNIQIAYVRSEELLLNNLIDFKNSFKENNKRPKSQNDKFVERQLLFRKKKEKEFEKDERYSTYFSKSKYDEIVVKNYEYVKGARRNVQTNNVLLFQDGQNLYYVIERNSNIRKEVVELLSKYNLKLFFDKGDSYAMKAMKMLTDDTVVTIPFYQFADTLQRLIFFKAAIQSNNETSLIFEEPESHMFPPYIKLFTNDIIKSNTNQFFINTHSPFVLNEFLENSIDELSVFVVGYNDGETKIKRLSEEELKDVYDSGVDLFFNIESYI